MAAKRRIYYLLFLAVGVYFVILYDFQGLRFLFCCAVFLPLICLVILVFSVFYCKVSLETEQDTYSRGEEIRLHITAENRSIFPVSRVLVCILYRENGGGEVKRKEWAYGFGRNREGRILVEMPARHCGQVEFVVTQAKIYDYLGLFSLPVRKQDRAEVCVIPVITPIAPGEIETSVFVSREKDGDMLLRDFQPGDSMHRIYWKLAAKTDELQVRDSEHSSARVLFLSFLPELRKRAEDWDRFLDRACSTLVFMMENSPARQDLPKVVWEQDGTFLEYEILDMGELYTWIYGMLMGDGIGLPFGEEEIPFLKEGCHLEEDCKLYLGERCIYDYGAMG